MVEIRPRDLASYTSEREDPITRYANDASMPDVPRDCFDAGDGTYLDPRSGFIHELATKKKLRECPIGEKRWIEAKCRTSNN